ncbi:ArsR/SmtB family transcription factor [Paenibacillus sp. Leaf72]|uniref:ArsR/SmtB family transcription factor n=1 Tax=Paenibacillus sp. Leaf72 TaxID=1736234 RepID=UPI0006F33BD3|nr:helix-turn-helix transcriptional regulator [Paenibacillus sp. Leaf72]KQN97696.1 ArsR family transcriptional regulator [Paenibacillus sp. Leaf72]
MDTLSILKAVSNEKRYHILKWLKTPEEHFGPQCHLTDACQFAGGVCVGSFAEKTGLAQSVISSYLVKMHKAGLLESKRIGQHTYYRRNEANIQFFKEMIQDEL